MKPKYLFLPVVCCLAVSVVAAAGIHPAGQAFRLESISLADGDMAVAAKRSVGQRITDKLEKSRRTREHNQRIRESKQREHEKQQQEQQAQRQNTTSDKQ